MTKRHHGTLESSKTPVFDALILVAHRTLKGLGLNTAAIATHCYCRPRPIGVCCSRRTYVLFAGGFATRVAFASTRCPIAPPS
jgi:hypothetical protein